MNVPPPALLWLSGAAVAPCAQWGQAASVPATLGVNPSSLPLLEIENL